MSHSEAQTQGIWAWDSELKERVLVIPFILALLGDNPMQSELAGHIGLTGRKFCRICSVQGKGGGEDEKDKDEDEDRRKDSEGSDVDEQPKKGKQKAENMADMMARIKRVVKVCPIYAMQLYITAIISGWSCSLPRGDNSDTSRDLHKINNIR